MNTVSEFPQFINKLFQNLIDQINMTVTAKLSKFLSPKNFKNKNLNFDNSNLQYFIGSKFRQVFFPSPFFFGYSLM